MAFASDMIHALEILSKGTELPLVMTSPMPRAIIIMPSEER